MELVAIQETIKILNDDDALDLFKKTLPSPSLLQMSRRAGDVRKEALSLVQKLKKDAKNPELSLITMALQGKKAGFAKVIKLIDEMVVKLGVEQEDDDAQKKWCEGEFDTTEDQTKDQPSDQGSRGQDQRDRGGDQDGHCRDCRVEEGHRGARRGGDGGDHAA